MSLFVRFWGTRGSIPTPGFKTKRYGGNTSCVEIRNDTSVFICDGGTGIRELGLDLLRRTTPPPLHLFFSHMHWDHIQGFPFFVPAYGEQNVLSVYEIAPGQTRIRELLTGQMRSEYFPVTFSDLGARIQSGFLEHAGKLIDGVSVRCMAQHHPGTSYAYSFEAEGKKVVYSTDNELDLLLADPVLALDQLEPLRLLPIDFVNFVRGADLLIADGQYTDDEYPKRIGWGHARTNTVVDLAVQAEVKQCAIFHHDPMQTDDDVDRKLDRAQERARRHGSNVLLFGAREGMELRI
ncbi:MAG: MBL fold metallo-hydrolase [Polyangiaceae bacterium]|nr:MBL fold metallo-hydrolase [Polyangiaceae bacterium]